MAIGTLGVLYYGLQTGEPPVAKAGVYAVSLSGTGAAHATTLAFTTFVLFQVFNVFNARFEKNSAFNHNFFANRMLWLAVTSVVILQILVIHWSPAQSIFHTTALTQKDWLIATGVAASILILEELRKLLRWSLFQK
jgi:Ca2+-transporting ATPase